MALSRNASLEIGSILLHESDSTVEAPETPSSERLFLSQAGFHSIPPEDVFEPMQRVTRPSKEERSHYLSQGYHPVIMDGKYFMINPKTSSTLLFNGKHLEECSPDRLKSLLSEQGSDTSYSNSDSLH